MYSFNKKNKKVNIRKKQQKNNSNNLSIETVV